MNIEKYKQIAHAAKIYSDAAFKLNSSFNVGENLYSLMPSQVLAALSLELYLKSIYYLEFGDDFKKDNKFSHDLESLFEKLKDSTKEFIMYKYNSIMQNRDMKDIRNLENAMNLQIDTSFLSMLNHWNGIFVNARYFYENKFANKMMLLFPELEDSLRSFILEKTDLGKK